MDRIEELRRSTSEADASGAARWISGRAEAEAARRTVGSRAPYLVPATFGCPSCGTVRIIASPAPLGTCDACGAQLAVLPT